MSSSPVGPGTSSLNGAALRSLTRAIARGCARETRCHAGTDARVEVAGALVESDGRLLLVRNQRRGGFEDWSTPGGVIDADDASVLAGLDARGRGGDRARVHRWEGPLYEVRGGGGRPRVAHALRGAPRGRVRGRGPRRRPRRHRRRSRVRPARRAPCPCWRECHRGCGEPLGEWLADPWDLGMPRAVRLRGARATCATPSTSSDSERRSRSWSGRTLRSCTSTSTRSTRRSSSSTTRRCGAAGDRRRARVPRRRRGRELRGPTVRQCQSAMPMAPRPARVPARGVPRAAVRGATAERARR